jgi:putative ABC transport system substrate-binding protein
VIDRRTFLGTLAGGLLAAPLVAEAQQAGTVYRLGVLRAGDPTPRGDSIDTAIRQGLKQFDFVEGTNLTIEYRSAEGRYDRLPDLVAELLRLRVDAILASPTVAALAAKNRTSTLPVVFTAVPDPVGAGLVASLSRPDGNVTGITSSAHDLTGKRLQLLKEVVAGIRVTVLVNPANRNAPAQLVETKEAAEKLGVSVEVLEARDPIGLDHAFSAIPAPGATAVFVLPDPMFYAQRKQIAQLALRRRLPTIFELRGFVDTGGLMSYGANLSEMYRKAATYVGRIFRGAKPADLPVEQPTAFEFVINLKTAKALGLTIAPSLLQRADQVIE